MRYSLLIGATAAALAPSVAQAQDHAGTSAAKSTTNAPAAAASQIVVTAAPLAHGLDQTPAIVVKIDADKILRSGGASIADALVDVPGIASTGFAAGASRPIIRGMDATRVRILEDGTSSSDVSDIGPDHGVPIDPLAARSIEVVRGAGTLRYGSQAIGGVINAINNRVPMKLPDTPLTGELTGSYGTVSDTWQGSALVDATMGDVALHADSFVRDLGDYDTPLGTQPNSFFRGHGGSLGGSYFIGGGDSHVGAAVVQYDSKYGIPSDTTYIDMKQTKVMTRSSFALGSGLFKTFNFDGSYANYEHSEKNPDGSILTTFRNKEWDGHGELLLNKIGPLTGAALGFEYTHRAFSAVGVDASYLFPATTESAAAYMFLETRLSDRLHVETSGRIENAKVSGTPASNVPTSRSFTPVSGAIGALYNAGPIKLGLTFSSTGRAPALTELFARGGHDGPNTYETGDPTLKVERANSLEGSLRVRTAPLDFDGSVYSTWFKNFIYGDLTGLTCDDAGACGVNGGDLKQMFYKQQGAHFRGLEGEAKIHLIHSDKGNLDVKLLGDYTRATFDDGSNVPLIPPYRVGGGLDWQSDQLDASTTLTYSGRQDKFGAFDTPTPGYYALGAQLAWRPFKAHPGIEFAIVGQNLTNAVQRDAAALNKDLVVAAGRNVRFVVKFANF